MTTRRTFLKIAGMGGLGASIVGCKGTISSDDPDASKDAAPGLDGDTPADAGISPDAAPVADGITPVLLHFRIDENQPTRVLFDSTKPISATSAAGFAITDASIDSITIAPGQTTGHYLTVDAAFSFWDNDTIRYEGGGDLEDFEGNALHPFTLRYIANNISEPAAPTVRYAAPNAQGAADGSAEANAWSYSQAAAEATAGTTVMMLAGTSGASFSVANSGTPTNPIKFIGYNNAGKNVEMERSPGIAFDNTVMPLFHGVTVAVPGRSNIIIKNVQIDRNAGAQHCTDLDSSTNVLLENTYMKEGKNGAFSFRTNILTRLRVKRYYACDMTGTSMSLPVDHGLIEDAYCCSSYDSGNDYYLNLLGTPSGSATIVRNSIVDRYFADSHGGHGLSIKADEYGNDFRIEHALMENVELFNVGGAAVEARHHEVQYCVYRNIVTHWGGVDNNTYAGLQITSAQNNTFENCTIDAEYGVRFLGSVEDPDAVDAGNNNRFINCIFNNSSGGFDIGIYLLADGDNQNRVPNNNEFIHCVFHDARSLFFNDPGQSGTGNKFIGCIFKDIPAKHFSGSSVDLGFSFEHCDFHNAWAVEAGEGNINQDPQFVDIEGFVPQNTALKAGVPLAGVEYDASEPPKEREDPPTIGAIEI
jgi:Right handed beta helix region